MSGLTSFIFGIIKEGTQEGVSELFHRNKEQANSPNTIQNPLEKAENSESLKLNGNQNPAALPQHLDCDNFAIGSPEKQLDAENKDKFELKA